MTGITAPTTVEAAMLSRRLLLLPDQGQVPGDLAEMIRGRRILLDPPAIHGVYGERRERASSPQCNSRPSWTKKFSDVVTNLLTADVLNVHSFSAWWKQTKQSNGFWVETPQALHRIHITPRRTFFYPDKWRTPYVDQKDCLLASLGNVRST